MLTYAYDVECFRNLFTVIFINVDNDVEKHTFIIGFDKDDTEKLKRFLSKEMILVGYNNHSYDDPMLRYIKSYNSTKINSDLFEFSSKLVDDNYRQDKTVLTFRYPRGTTELWHSVDLMKIMGFNNIGISLKQISINLKWHKIQDIPLEINERVGINDLSMIIEYNLNDVLITKRLYEEIEPIRKLRIELSRLYNIDLTSASDSHVANLILEDIYEKTLRADISDLRGKRTHREKILIGDCIADFVEFNTPQLKELVKEISATMVYKYKKYYYSKTIYFANCEFGLGIGGLHTKDSPGIFSSDENVLIQDMDVASYYPNLIINNNFYPEHLGPSFIKVLKKITRERLKAKKDGDKVKADGLKITINSIFGKLGFEYFWLYDPKQFISTTINGQLGLLMLIEQLYLSGISIISANTDGIICSIPREKLEEYYDISRKWEKKTGLELEYTPYKKYIRRDVNSYITEKEDGSTKEKGIFVRDIDLKRGYRMPIVAEALYQYFVNNIPVRKTLESSKDILDFCISQKTGSNFIMELHKLDNIEKLQKTNRFFISNSGGVLLKRDKYSNRLTGLYVGNYATILNNYDKSKPFSEYDINYSFYEQEVMKIINDIQPPQKSLFSMDTGNWGTINKASAESATREKIKPAKTIDELQKLGKNQFKERLSQIVKSNETIPRANSRYVYVTNFDIKTMVIEIYCLKKGNYSTLLLDKVAYKENGLEEGSLIYCEDFKQGKDGLYILTKYKICDIIEENKKKLL